MKKDSGDTKRILDDLFVLTVGAIVIICMAAAATVILTGVVLLIKNMIA